MFNFKQKITNGALIDVRDPSEKLWDYRHEELGLASGITLVDKHESCWRKFLIRNQLNTSSCVAHATTKVIGIENYIEEGKFLNLSPRFIYAQRSNTGAGMYGIDASKIACTKGAPIEEQVPFINNESKMSKIDDATVYDFQTALVAKQDSYIQMNITDIDQIAQFIESTGKGVMLFFKFNSAEWTTVPTIRSGVAINCYHAVCGTNCILYNGDTAIVIEDSWGPGSGNGGRRIITRDWFVNNRCTFAAYFIDLKNNWRDTVDTTIEKPQHTFGVNLVLGNNNDEVKALQNCLKYLKFFPNVQECTGYYGGITARAVLDFQKKYIGETTEIINLKGKSCGPKTRDKLNEIFK